jgi:carboxypeptidase D
MYCPYIANEMLAAEDANYFNLKGMLIYDPVMVDDRITELNVVPFVDYHRSLFPLNDSFAKQIHDTDRKCGYADARRRYLKYPALGHLPDLLPGVDANSKEPRPRCDDLMLFELVIQAMSDINPCFNVYHVATTCPLLWDVLGFPGSFDYLPKGASIYFDRQDVKRAINAPLNRTWVSCGGPVFVREDNSPPSGSTVFGNVIDRTRNVVIAHGALDFILLANATLMAIQNMTFGGKLGFQKPPTEPFYVPYHTHGENSTLAGAGVFGTTHTERGLTYVGVSLSGHMVPQYAPSAAFRQLEFLLGRVRSLRSKKPFSIDPKFPQPHGPLGKGTAPPGYNHDKPGKRRDGKGSV